MDFSWLFIPLIFFFPLLLSTSFLGWKRGIVFVMVICCIFEAGISVINELSERRKVAPANVFLALVIFLLALGLTWLKMHKQHKRIEVQDYIRIGAALLCLILRLIELYLLRHCKDGSSCYSLMTKYNWSMVGPILAIAATAEKLVSWKDEMAPKQSYMIVTYGDMRCLIDSYTNNTWMKYDIQLNHTRSYINGTSVGIMEVKDVETLISVGAKVGDVILIHCEEGKTLNIPEEEMKELKCSGVPSILVSMTSSKSAELMPDSVNPASSSTAYEDPASAAYDDSAGTSTAHPAGAPIEDRGGASTANKDPTGASPIDETDQIVPVYESMNQGHLDPPNRTNDLVINLAAARSHTSGPQLLIAEASIDQASHGGGSSYQLKKIGAEKCITYDVDDVHSMRKVFEEAFAYKL